MIRLPGENFKKGVFFVIALCIFFSKCPLQIWTSKTSNNDISKTITACTITACSLRFGQLKEVDE